MLADFFAEFDLMPSAFEEGLALWSSGDGTPESPTYDVATNARLARNDAEFGACLEVRKTDDVLRLRYTGEMPVPRGALVAVTVRLRAMRGPLPSARIAAWTGGASGREVAEQPCVGALTTLEEHATVHSVTAVIGPVGSAEADLAWSADVLYAHVGLDLTGPVGGVVRIESVEARDVTRALTGSGRVMPGFTTEDAT